MKASSCCARSLTPGTQTKSSTGGPLCLESKSIPLESDHDVAIARAQVRLLAAALGFRLLDQTRLATVASELARNVVKYAGRGRLIAQPTTQEHTGRDGLRLIFEDEGPGISNLDDALRDGF